MDGATGAKEVQVDGNGRRAEVVESAPSGLCLGDVPAALLAVGRSGAIVDVNVRAALLLDTSPGAAIGQPLAWLVAQEARAGLVDVLGEDGPFTVAAWLRDDSARRVRLDGTGLMADGTRLVAVTESPVSTTAVPATELAVAHMFLSLNEGYAIFDATPAIVECNDAAARILGTTREALLGQPGFRAAGFPIIGADGHPYGEGEGPIGECFRTRQPSEEIVFMAETRTGRRWIKASVRPIPRADGVVEHVVAHFADVTETRELAGRLDLAERRFRTLIEHLPLVVYVDLPDHSATSVYSSPQVREMLGYSLDEWTDSKSFWEMVHPDDRERVRTALQAQLETSGRFLEEYRFIAADGRIVWVRDESIVICDDDGEQRYIEGYYLDITERHRSEDELRVERERFLQLAENIDELFFVFDLTEDRFVYASPAYERLTGLPVADVYASPDAYLEAIHPDDRHLVTREAFDIQGPRGTVDFRFRRADGAVGWMRSRWFPVFEDDVPVRAVGVAQEITAARLAEQRLRADAEALGRLGAAATSEAELEARLRRVLEIGMSRFGFAAGLLVAPPTPGRSELIVMAGADVDAVDLAARCVSVAREHAHTGSDLLSVPLPGALGQRGLLVPLPGYPSESGAFVFAGESTTLDEGERELLSLMARWAHYEISRDAAQVELRENAEVHRALSDSLRRLGDRVETVLEDERARIAREVHDELGQALTALKFDLHWMEDRVADEAAERLSLMIQTVENTIDAVRRVCADLRPPMLDDLGLVAALEWHAASIERATGIRCEVSSTVRAERSIPPQVATEAFRIAQEALTNVSRHAGAARARVVVGVAGDTLELRIEDDGRGIAAPDASGGLGILGMRERALRLGGRLEVEPSVEGGAAVVLRVPLLPPL